MFGLLQTGVGPGTLLIAAVTLLASMGILFEIGRRIGESNVRQTENEVGIEELERKMDEKFDGLDTRLTHAEAVREREHKIVIEWLSELTDALKNEGYDVEKPDAVSRSIDIDPDHENPSDD